LLGKPALKGRISDNEVSYWLKSEGFLAMWELYIILMITEILNPQGLQIPIKNRRNFFSNQNLLKK